MKVFGVLFFAVFASISSMEQVEAAVRCKVNLRAGSKNGSVVATVSFSRRVRKFSLQHVQIEGGTSRRVKRVRLSKHARRSVYRMSVRPSIGTINQVSVRTLYARRPLRAKGLRSKAVRCDNTLILRRTSSDNSTPIPSSPQPTLTELPKIDITSGTPAVPEQQPSSNLPTNKIPEASTPTPVPQTPITGRDSQGPITRSIIVNPVQSPVSGKVASNCSQTGELAVSTLPILPRGEGFGMTTVAGSGRHLKTPCASIYKVNSLRDAGPGTLRECMEAKGPRTCIFEVGGMIWATQDIRVTSPYLTVAGQTAPRPGIVLRGSGISVETSDVLIQHLRVRPGDDPRASCCASKSCSVVEGQLCTTDPGSRDGVKIRALTSSVSRVVLDHLSVSWALDEGLSLVPENGDITDVSFTNSIIASGLDMSIHPETNTPGDLGHSKAVLISGAKKVARLSFVKNLLANNADRNIRSSTALGMEFVNNLVYNWGRGGGRTIELTNKIRATHQLDVIGNLYVPGPDTYCPTTLYRPELCLADGADGIDTAVEQARMHFILRVGGGVAGGLSANSRYFVQDNIGPTRSNPASDQWAAVDRGLFVSGTNTLIYPAVAATSPVSSSGRVTVIPTNDLAAYVMRSVGALAAERDAVDALAIEQFRTRTGHIINCVEENGSSRCQKNGGGWPDYTPAAHRWDLPQSPFSDDDGDGYTNLEELLNEDARLQERVAR